MSRASLLKPPDAWLCHGCGWGTCLKRPPDRCPKCNGMTFERMGAAASVEEGRPGDREAEGLGRLENGGTAMRDFVCAGGCGQKVSQAGGRCRKCAGLLRRKKRGEPVAVKKDPPSQGRADPEEAVRGVAEALRAAGFNVADVRVQEATLLVRLMA